MPQVDTASRPLVFVWELTRACDLACKHCRADAQPDRHPDELTTVEAKRLLSDVARFGDDQIVVLSGGDPLAREDTIELVEYGAERGLQVTITPSGTNRLSGDRIRSLVKGGIRRIALSFDGASPETHDAFRGEVGSFDATMRAASEIRAADIPLQINTTVCEETLDDLPALRELVSELDATMWSVFFLVQVGRGRTLTPISPQRAERLMHWLAKVNEISEFTVKTTEAPFYRRVQLQRLHHSPASYTEGDDKSQVRGEGILAGDGFAFVSHVGEMYPSGFLLYSVGNVRHESALSLYRDKELFVRLRDRDALKGKCGVCPYRFACGGSRSRAYTETGHPLGSDPLCPFIPEGYNGPLPQRLSQ